jgi:SAM-dependent methyltransferase
MTGNQARSEDSQHGEPSSQTTEQVVPVDVPELMHQIRERVAARLQAEPDARRPFKPFVADDKTLGDRKAGELLYSEDLRFLNVHHATGLVLNPDSVATHRKGIIGKVIVRVKRKVRTIVWDLLKDHVAAEREFQGHLIRYLNDVSKYVDARDATNFWELIRKIDVDVARCIERIERVQDDVRAEIERLRSIVPEGEQARVTILAERVNEQHHTIKVLDSVVRGLEGIVARFPVKSRITEASVQNSSGETSSGYSYLLLENRFRGSEAEIADRVGRYVEFFRGSLLPVLEVGPGRGELLTLLREAGVRSYGVDLDQSMVETSLNRGLEVLYGDGIAHLRSLDDRSLGGLVAIQVVEHLPREVLEEFCRLAAQKVVARGKIIFETINPQSLMALSSNYFRDPTHVFPQHPDTLRYTMELSGLTQCAVQYLSPVPVEAQLQELPSFEFLSPQGVSAVQHLNQVIQQLNKLIYGYQDFCVVAEAP